MRGHPGPTPFFAPHCGRGRDLDEHTDTEAHAQMQILYSRLELHYFSILVQVCWPNAIFFIFVQAACGHSVAAMTNQRRGLLSEGTLQEEGPWSQAQRHLRDQDRQVADPPQRRQRQGRRHNGEDVEPRAHAEATVKTIPYDERSESRGAEVSDPVLVRLELEQDKEETRR